MSQEYRDSAAGAGEWLLLLIASKVAVTLDEWWIIYWCWLSSSLAPVSALILALFVLGSYLWPGTMFASCIPLHCSVRLYFLRLASLHSHWINKVDPVETWLQHRGAHQRPETSSTNNNTKLISIFYLHLPVQSTVHKWTINMKAHVAYFLSFPCACAFKAKFFYLFLNSKLYVLFHWTWMMVWCMMLFTLTRDILKRISRVLMMSRRQ